MVVGTRVAKFFLFLAVMQSQAILCVGGHLHHPIPQPAASEDGGFTCHEKWDYRKIFACFNFADFVLP